MTIERRARGAWLLAATGLALACGAAPEGAVPAAPAVGAVPDTTSWSVTAWGERFEVFPEAAPLTAGEETVVSTHVTRLAGFAPLTEGSVAIVLAGPGGEQVFAADRPVRPGIFAVSIRPPAAGEVDLRFRIESPEGVETIRGGRLRIGDRDRPGALLVAPAPRGASDDGDPIAFTKEAQWRSDFATAWVRDGQLARSVSGLTRVRPPAGGEAALSTPVDGVLHPPGGAGSWPFAGRRVDRSEPLFRVMPLVAAERSLPSLEADLASLASERETARDRLARLEELLRLEATSRRAVDEARTRVATLEARHAAAAADLEAARASRQGGLAGALILRAPFAGAIAEVAARPGATVAAGAPIARLVRTDRLWLEVALAPEGVRELAAAGVAGIVLEPSEGPPVRIEEGLRPVATAPELSPTTGTVTAFLEAPGHPGLTLGATMAGHVLLRDTRAGIVVPASAVIDDGGVPVVYLQLAGERFVRQQVRVVTRQGERLLVEGLVPGQRLVTRGGESIRRSSLMATGDAHGHIH